MELTRTSRTNTQWLEASIEDRNKTRDETVYKAGFRARAPSGDASSAAPVQALGDGLGGQVGCIYALPGAISSESEWDPRIVPQTVINVKCLI